MMCSLLHDDPTLVAVILPASEASMLRELEKVLLEGVCIVVTQHKPSAHTASCDIAAHG